MDENKDMIDEDPIEDIDVDDEDDTDIDVTDEGDSEDADDSGSDDDFEYDENGDIIIPDDEEDTEDDGTADGDDDNDDGESGGEGDASEDDTPPADEKDQKIADLEKQLADFKKYGAAALKKLGVEGEDVTEGFIKIAAEAEGITPDELKQRITAENAQRSAAQERQALIEREDLAAIQAVFPSAKDYKSISEIPNFKRFGELRDAGATPLEAFRAANPDGVRAEAAQAANAASIKGTKEHLKSSVPKGTKDTSTRIPKAEFEKYRDMFPNKSKEEIIKLYKESI